MDWQESWWVGGWAGKKVGGWVGGQETRWVGR